MQRLAKQYYKDDGKNSLYFLHTPKSLYKKLNKQVKQSTVNDFLQQQRNYTLFKRPTEFRFKRNPYRVFHIDQCWEIDLLSFPSLAKFNSGFSHLLVCIDLFSRYAFVRCLRTKKPHEIIKNLVDIFRSSNRKPTILRSDKGGEFINKEVKGFLKKENIEMRTPLTTLKAKCAYAESLNRTLRLLISRYLNYKKVTHQPNEHRYVDAIQSIVDTYNHTRHSRLKMAPADVNKANATRVYHLQKLQAEKIQPKAPRLMENTFVRVIRKRKLFDKATLQPYWSDEIFRVKDVIMRRPFPLYILQDLKGQTINGKFYEQELQQIQLPLDTPIKILQKPNIFEKNKKTQVRTIVGKTRVVDLKEEKYRRRENNYSDVVSRLFPFHE